MEYPDSEEDAVEDAVEDAPVRYDSLISHVNSLVAGGPDHDAGKTSRRTVVGDIRAAVRDMRKNGITAYLVPVSDGYKVKIGEEFSLVFPNRISASRALVDAYAKHRG